MPKRTAEKADITAAPPGKMVYDAALPSVVLEQLSAMRDKEPHLEIIEINEEGSYQRFLVPTKSLDQALLIYIVGLTRQPGTPAHPSEYYDTEVKGSADQQQARALCKLMGAYLAAVPDDEQDDLVPDFCTLKREPLPVGHMVRTNEDLHKFCSQAEETLLYSHNIIATLLISDHC